MEGRRCKRAKERERERKGESGKEREERRENGVSMAAKRRGVYVVSADVSFLLANKASL